jgi:hypothetical protein
MAGSAFAYSVTRDPELKPWLRNVIYVLAAVYITTITILNITVTGYDVVPVVSANFNATYSLWYEKLIPILDWIPQTWNCGASVIQLKERNA